jgi:transketolase
VVSGAANKGVVICATGSEVWLACEAAKLLSGDGINVRIVSVPCVERFMEQPQEYRQEVIPVGAKVVAVEAGSMCGWERVVGSQALLLGIETFGASAPGEVLAQKFGFTPKAVAERIRAWIEGG